MEFLCKMQIFESTVYFQIIKKLTIIYLIFYKFNIETDRIIIFRDKMFSRLIIDVIT